MTESVGGAQAWNRGPGPSTSPVWPGPVCFLRVYEPLAAFAGEERTRWERYAASGAAPDRPAGAAREREAALRALVGRPGSWTGLPVVGDEAFVLDIDGVTVVCPWRTELRAWQALGDFRDGLAAEIADAFSPRAAAQVAQQRLADLRVGDPTLRSHVLSSTWSVPLRWFVLVDADERSVEVGEGQFGRGEAVSSLRTGRHLLYRTAMSRARRRTARALAVLRRTVDDGAVTAGVEDIGRWLEDFHPRSLVELDYGGLVHLLEDGELRQDESARDVAAALAALSSDVPARAATAYARVTARMKALQALEAAS